jgi:nitrate/nitrite-specific signal transduction histidine kinase
MPTMTREAWTDERLDDLATRVDEGFREAREDLRTFRLEVKSDFASLRGEMDNRFSKLESSIDARFDKVEARFERMDARFDSLQRTLLGGMLTFVLAIVLTHV